MFRFKIIVGVVIGFIIGFLMYVTEAPIAILAALIGIPLSFLTKDKISVETVWWALLVLVPLVCTILGGWIASKINKK